MNPQKPSFLIQLLTFICVSRNVHLRHFPHRRISCQDRLRKRAVLNADSSHPLTQVVLTGTRAATSGCCRVAVSELNAR